jgi:nicotinamidase-related amidase
MEMFKRYKTNEPVLSGVNGTDIVRDLSPEQDDLVLEKCFPSAFFATPLHSYLTPMGIDTLLVTGFVTSGCIRATVNDACENGYHTMVIENCVADRFKFLHHAELLTMDLKYADVLLLDEVLGYLETVGS